MGERSEQWLREMNAEQAEVQAAIADQMTEARDQRTDIVPAVPQLDTYEQAREWIEERAAHYPSRNEFFASREYRDAYPRIQELTEQYEQELSTEAEQAMREAGIKSGDDVVYVPPGALPGQEVSGRVFLRKGVPYVRLSTPVADGRKTTRWHRGFQRVEDAVPETQTYQQRNQDRILRVARAES